MYEVSLVLDHQLCLGSPVDEEVVCVLEFEVLGCELSEFVIVLGSELSPLTIEGHYEPVKLVMVLSVLDREWTVFICFS